MDFRSIPQTRLGLRCAAAPVPKPRAVWCVCLSLGLRCAAAPVPKPRAVWCVRLSLGLRCAAAPVLKPRAVWCVRLSLGLRCTSVLFAVLFAGGLAGAALETRSGAVLLAAGLAGAVWLCAAMLLSISHPALGCGRPVGMRLSVSHPALGCASLCCCSCPEEASRCVSEVCRPPLCCCSCSEGREPMCRGGVSASAVLLPLFRGLEPLLLVACARPCCTRVPSPCRVAA